MSGYDPRKPGLLTFHDATVRFSGGADSPADYLERCLAAIAEREPRLRAFTVTLFEGAREAANAATIRWREGKPLSPVDGLPIAIKDIFETVDAPRSFGVAGLATAPALADAAIVGALKDLGAAICGKTALPELGFGKPPPTTNPHDAARSPGGSSSGSAALVGAGLLPVAIGTQGKGSLTRPASFCGAYAFKPGHGTIHRGGDGGAQATNTHIGTLAGSLEDAWIVARLLSEHAGPHPGHVGIKGPMAPPAPVAPRRLVRLEGPGWAAMEVSARKAYEDMLGALAGTGIDIAAAEDDPATRALEAELPAAAEALSVIADYESRWPLVALLRRNLAENGGRFDPLTVERGLGRADVTRAAYEAALAFRRAFREKLAACAAPGVLFISPSATGIAPDGLDETGSAIYQWGSSLAGNPVVSLPLMAADGLPLGLQIQGFIGGEEGLMAAALALDGAFRRGEI